MIAKMFEIRDAHTFIPVVAVLCQVDATVSPAAKENYLLRRAGYGHDHCVLLTKAIGGEANYDPYRWTSQSRTMQAAHIYIEKNFALLKTGEVIDVEFILGESKAKKISEQDDETHDSPNPLRAV